MSNAALMLLDDSQALVYAGLVGHVEKITAISIQPIHSEPESKDLNELLLRGKKARKKIEAERKKMVGPLNEQVGMINDLFKGLVKSLTDFEEKASAVQIVYRKRRDEEIRKQKEEAERKEYEARVAEAKAVMEAENAKTEEDRKEALKKVQAAQDEQSWAKLEAPVLATGCKSESGSSHIRKVVDKEAIEIAVNNGVREIPGVVIFQKWTFEIVDSSQVPEKYRKDTLATRSRRS